MFSKQTSNLMYCLVLCTILGTVLTLPITQQKAFNQNNQINVLMPLKPVDANLRIGLAVSADQLPSPHQLYKRASSTLDTPADLDADDMALAEINVFRPLFRYRAAISRQVGQGQQFGR